MPETRVLVVDDSALHARIVADALRGAGFQVEVAKDGEEGLKLVESWRPDAVVLDVVMPGMDGYQVCQALRQREATKHIPVIMLTSRGGIEAKVAGFEAGADDYLVKPVDPTELVVRLKVLLRRVQMVEAAAPHVGRFIVLFSLRGGVGVTSLAANLAVALAGLWDTDVPLVDLALTMGQAALMFNIKPTASIQDLAERSPSDLDEEIVEQALHPHPTGVRVLPAPPSPEGAEKVSDTHVNTILSLLKGRYSYVVADLPGDFQATTLAALDQADHILLLLTPELASVQAAARALNVFDALGYPREKVHLVMNWTFRRGGLPQKKIEAALRKPMEAVIPFAPDLFIPALNRGTPLLVGHPDSEAAARIEELAFSLTRPERLPGPGEKTTPMLARVRERLGV